ncbi:hypothetical protein STEG23_018787 [Scotinomys teguina]
MHWRKVPPLDLRLLLSDQTPTPTRFLKNCEEVGLFSELDCSFEHEFRKAQEEENSERFHCCSPLLSAPEARGQMHVFMFAPQAIDQLSYIPSPFPAAWPLPDYHILLSACQMSPEFAYNISMHNTVGGTMTGPGAHQLGSTRMPNHDTSVVIQQAMPSPQSSSVITQAPSTNRQIGHPVQPFSSPKLRLLLSS